MAELKLDLSPRQLEIVQQILQAQIPQYAVWAFGSRINHTAKPYSDLDLAILCNQPLSLMVQANLEEAFSESDLPFRVDLIDWATTSKSFRAIIQKAYLVLQKGLA